MDRHTPQRDAIRAAIRLARRPLAPDEVLAAARKRCRSLGQATVYRTLNAGVEEGWLQTVQLPNGPTRYEPAELPHHHHFECVDCHRVFDVAGCPGHMDTLVPDGFTLEHHEVLLYGKCEACSA